MEELLNTKQASEILKVNEKKIYVLAQQGKIPATMVTGKWLFPKNKLEKFIEEKSDENLSTARKIDYSKTILGSGSDDPTIDLIHTCFPDFDKNYNFFYSRLGSFGGLDLLKNRGCDISFSHIYDDKSDDYNFSFLSNKFNINDVIVVNLFYRNIGFVYKKDLKIKDFKDLIKHNLNFINRQKGSGIRNYIDLLIENENISKTDIRGYDDEVNTHNDVGIKIITSSKEIGIATEHISKVYNLNFNFLQKERFDVIIPKESFFEKKVQKFINLIQYDNFKNNILNFKGYDTNDTGKILFSK